MKLSFNWLCDYVDLDGLSAQEVADKLTMGAFEVEEVSKVGADIQGPVVVGKILEIMPHPNASKIRMTKVTTGNGGGPLGIVCGAQNIEVGQVVPVALPGAKVVNRHDGSALDIKLSEIRGVQSQGMLCSPPELGLNMPDSEGILILGNDTKLGASVVELLDLVPDYVLHVEPRSNRGDALSVLGLAREVAALCNRSLKTPAWELPQGANSLSKLAEPLSSDCPYLSLRVINGIKIGPSPRAIAARLEAIGVRTVNNLVDITNYVMHELGQPLHAYDMTKIDLASMQARAGRTGETLETIDAKSRNLTDEVLVIADKNKVLGVAGVMGGKDSEITDNTCDIALEAASFASARVRRSSRLLGLSSDSSLRFERGVDIALARMASDRAASLILEHCGGTIGQLHIAGEDKVQAVTVTMRLSQLKRLLKIEISPSEVIALLKPLGFEGAVLDDDRLEFIVPSYRQKDVSREIDIIEEVCRLYGYDKITPSMPVTSFAPERPCPVRGIVSSIMVGQGFSEAWISSLAAPPPSLTGKENLTEAITALTGSLLDDGSSAVRVKNPLSADHVVLRSDLAPGLINATKYNIAHGQENVWLFEVGRVYEVTGTASGAKETGVAEQERIAAVITGRRERSIWSAAKKHKQEGQAVETQALFFDIKGIAEVLLDGLKIDQAKIRFKRQENLPAWYHPGRSCAIVLDRGKASINLGFIGEMHPAWLKSNDIHSACALLEMNLDALRQLQTSLKFGEIVTNPPVYRDLTLDTSKDVDSFSVYSTIKKAGGEILKTVELVSIFELQETVRSLSYRLKFQDKNATLTAESVEKIMVSIRERLQKEVACSFRS